MNQIEYLKDSRILFFVPGSSVLNGGTFASQVLGQARALVKLGAQCAILHKHRIAQAKVVDLEKGITLLNLTDEDPEYGILFLKARFEKILERFSSEIRTFNPTHIYTRNYACSLAARELANELHAKLVYSMRGPDAYERRKAGGFRNFIISCLINIGVKKAVHTCDAFTTLSRNFVMWCKSAFGADSILLPCCIADRFFTVIDDNIRRETRDALGFKDSDIVIVWCGNVAYWQMLDCVVKLLKRLSDFDDHYKFLFLADSPEIIQRKCVEFGLCQSKYHVFRASPDDVPTYLQSCDAGIDLLKEDDFKSSICCPIKVGEYMASGLPVIISRTMGDYPDIIRATNAGCIVASDATGESVSRQLQPLLHRERSYFIDVARKSFSWSCYREEMIQLFT